MKKAIFMTAVVMGILSLAQAVPLRAQPDYQAKVKASMQLLKQKLNALGEPRLQGTDTAAEKTVPAIYFGKIKQNNNYDVVDAVKAEVGGTATIFVKNGAEFVRVTTNVLKDDGGRAVGTELARNAAYDAITKGQTFYGRVDILGKPFETAYEPIKNGAGEVIGIYYVGYKQR